ncbi:MAG: hypothetical protein K1X89_21320 [Myxococcaceae bacterium]|nr:hypothetical protein [Myxococcaceae bacterium]
MRRRIRELLMLTLLVFGAVYLLASLNWCPPWPERAARKVSAARQDGPWRAGAAEVDLDVPYPVTMGGYGPPRATATRANRRPRARALVISSGELTVALVSLDVVLVPRPVVDRVRLESGMPTAVVFATHTHTSLGQFDERPMAELGGLGWYRESARDALIHAAAQAIAVAKGAQTEVVPELVTAAHAGLCRPRTGAACDERLERLVLRGPSGPVAQLVVTAAHPVLVPRGSDALDSDYPGLFADLARERGEGITLVAQGAGGNASVAGERTPQAQVDALGAALSGLDAGAGEDAPPRLTLTVASTTLPHADGSRLVPALSRNPANNLACQKAEMEAEVVRLGLGPLTLLAVPAEVTAAAAPALESAAKASRVLSLAGGYLGYLEPVEVVRANEGEAWRQYYAPELASALAEAAALTAP